MRIGQPWTETVEQLSARMRGIVQHINTNHDVENLCRELHYRLQEVTDAKVGAVIASSGPMGPILAIQFALRVILASWFPIQVELVDTPGQRKSTRRRHAGHLESKRKDAQGQAQGRTQG